MKLDVPWKLMERFDAGPLARFAEVRLGPLYDSPERAAWAAVEERSRWIGEAARPADVGYRKMRPTGYLQLCVTNDEVPPSPWALPIPEELASAAELAALVLPVEELCRRHYGAGVLHFCVFAVLAPGGEVPVHRDMPHDVNKKRFSHHLHLPLLHAEGAEFVVGGATFTMEPGGPTRSTTSFSTRR